MPQHRAINTLLVKVENEKAMLRFRWFGIGIALLGAIGDIVGLGLASPILAGRLAESQWIAAQVQAFIAVLTYAVMFINSQHRIRLLAPIKIV